MTATPSLSGFYAVLDRDSEKLARSLVSSAADRSGAGAAALQLRIKPDTPVAARELLRIGAVARRITRDAGALFVVNDRVDLAVALEADAVHLGQDDLPLADARRLLATVGRPMLIGISTHDERQVRAAVDGGADYLGFGPVFATPTKRNPDPVQGVDGLARAVALAGDLPVVAIGGITPANAAAVAAAGAAAACAISSVNDAPDPGAAGRAIGGLFSASCAP